MNTLRGLLGRERRSDRPALRAPGDPERAYDYRRLLTDAWKTSNFLSHRGVRSGRRVAIAGRRPEAVLAFLGTAVLGGISLLDPPATVDARALVAPVARVSEYDLPPGGQRVAYGGAPDDPGIAHFEAAVWSENPTLAPADISPASAVLATADRAFTHTDLLTAAERVVERAGLDGNEAVTLRAPLADPGAVVAGVVAPLLAGATVLLPDEGAVGDVAVAVGEDAPEARTVDPTTVF